MPRCGLIIRKIVELRLITGNVIEIIVRTISHEHSTHTRMATTIINLTLSTSDSELGPPRSAEPTPVPPLYESDPGPPRMEFVSHVSSLSARSDILRRKWVNEVINVLKIT